ncbi:MAG TPA: RDD family protein [Chitinophaga sp.]|uniref:RDD family protein n=1 Tax=Chitinophaga sp. TaxID=1869181 RepID=UPI002DB8E54A|nr:RDD family protein [Chitinophaga sp.]HEU4552813.1 RDD family protein [Chitinophaga sp.]
MAAIKIPTAFNIDLEFEAADIGQRIAAWFIDLLVRAGYLCLILVVVANVRWSGDNGTIFAFWTILIPISFYFLVLEIFMGGQTPGKKAMGIKVVSLLGNPPSFSQHMIRWLFRILETPLIIWGVVPIVAIIRSKYNQRLGDLVAGTIVVNTKTKSKLSDTIFRDISQANYEPHFPQILRLSDKDLNKVKELMDLALKSNNLELSAKVSYRVRDVLKIETDMDHMQFLETLLNDYNYYVTKD